MNFKRLRGIYAVALITIAAAFFAGCSNSMAGSVDGGVGAGMSVLHFSATGIPEEYAKEFDAYNDRLNARTILPNNPFDITTGTGLVFVLAGTSAGDTYGPQKVELATPASGSGYDFTLPDGSSVTMDPKLWTLTLTAYASDASADGYDPTKPVLQGRTIVDLRNGSGTATIQLGIGGLPTKASVAVSGMIVDPNNIASYAVAGIYKKIGLADVGGTEQRIDPLGTDTVTDVDLTNVAATAVKKSFEFTANNSAVSPGKYLFIINFYNGDDVIVGTYTDIIVINPGNDMNQVIKTPIYMGTLPSAPADLMASVIKDDGDTYLLKVEWTEATDVTNYELNLSTFDDKDVDGDDDYQDDIDTYFTPEAVETDRTKANYSLIDNGRIKNGQVYGVSLMSTAAEGVIDFVTSDIIGDESSPMMYGDSSCVLRLETGKVYEIQLRARNFLGASHWVDRVVSVASATPDTVIYRYKAPADQRINRMYVEYNLNGGEMTLSTETTPESGNYYVDYWSWTKNLALLEKNSTPATEYGLTRFKNFVNKSGTDFDAWKLTKGSAIATADSKETSTSDTIVEAYTYKNAKVIASFGNKLSGSVTQEDMMVDVVRSHVAFNVYKSDGTTPVGITVDTTSGISVIKKLSDGENNILQIKLNNAFDTGVFSDANLYTNVRAEAWVGNYATDPIKTLGMDSVYGVFKLSTAGYDPGQILNIRVIADTETLTGASHTYQFVIR